MVRAVDVTESFTTGVSEGEWISRQGF